MYKVIIYTAIFGDYDNLIENQFIQDKNVKYICFTDNKNLKSQIWEIIVCKKKFNNPNLSAKYYKILSHKLFKTDYSLWLDGNIAITGNVNDLINKFLVNSDICFHKHPSRNCLYKEAKYLIKYKKGNEEKIINQINKYKNENYPAENGLNAGGIILRSHKKTISDFNDYWWNEIINNSLRDQISLNYILYKLKINYNVFDFPLPDSRNPNNFFSYDLHIPYYKNFFKKTSYKSFYIYCYSLNGKKAVKFIQQTKFKILGIYDKDKNIVPHDLYIDLYNDTNINKSIPVLVFSKSYFNEIYTMLINSGFKNIINAL